MPHHDPRRTSTPTRLVRAYKTTSPSVWVSPYCCGPAECGPLMTTGSAWAEHVMANLHRIQLTVVLIFATLTAAAEPSWAQQRPNVVFILADNVGYGDIGVYGGGELRGAPTPRIDQLAREGLRLTQYLVEPACTPSRAALMTGQYSIRSGLSLIAIGNDLVAARWKQWRIYFTDIHPTGTGPQRQPGMFSTSASMAGYPRVYNIEMDPHEDLIVGGLFGWVSDPALKVVEEYMASLKKHPNPPAPNITRFGNGG